MLPQLGVADSLDLLTVYTAYKMYSWPQVIQAYQLCTALGFDDRNTWEILGQLGATRSTSAATAMGVSR